MSRSKAIMPALHFGPVGSKHVPKNLWGDSPDDRDDDAVLAKTPPDVVAMLGFDPLDDAAASLSDLTVTLPKVTKDGKKTTRYETVHGAEAVRALRAQHQAAFQNLLAHLTGPVKARIIGSISRQAAAQLKAKVTPAHLHFVLEPHLEKLVEAEIQKIYDQAKSQVKAEVKKKKK